MILTTSAENHFEIACANVYLLFSRTERWQVPWSKCAVLHCSIMQTQRYYRQYSIGLSVNVQCCRKKASRRQCYTSCFSYNKLFRLRNDLYCVEWGVKLYSLTHSACSVWSTQTYFALTSAKTFTRRRVDGIVKELGLTVRMKYAWFPAFRIRAVKPYRCRCKST